MQVLSAHTPTEAEEIGGLPNEAIAGLVGVPAQDRNSLSAVTGGRFSRGEFRPNPAFAVFMHNVIRTFGPHTRELQDEAQRQGNGFIYIIDLRTPEGQMGNVPPEDIIGAFAVENGKLGAYEPNHEHLVFSANGLVQLPPSLNELHRQQLRRMKVV